MQAVRYRFKKRFLKTVEITLIFLKKITIAKKQEKGSLEGLIFRALMMEGREKGSKVGSRAVSRRRLTLRPINFQNGLIYL